jgi:hypothetical protein
VKSLQVITAERAGEFVFEEDGCGELSVRQHIESHFIASSRIKIKAANNQIIVMKIIPYFAILLEGQLDALCIEKPRAYNPAPPLLVFGGV